MSVRVPERNDPLASSLASPSARTRAVKNADDRTDLTDGSAMIRPFSLAALSFSRKKRKAHKRKRYNGCRYNLEYLSRQTLKLTIVDLSSSRGKSGTSFPAAHRRCKTKRDRCATCDRTIPALPAATIRPRAFTSNQF